MNHHPPPHLPQVRPPISNNGPHQINRMQPAMRNIVLECIILEPLDFKPKMDGMAIGTYRVADETGSIFMTVKLDPSDQLKAGDIVRFQDCEVKAPGNRFNIQINATRGNNRFKRIGSDTKIYHELPYWTESEWYWDPQLQHMVLNSGSGPMNQLPGGPGGPGGPNLQNQQRMQGNNMQPAINPAFQNNQRPGPGPMHGPRPPFQGGNLHGNAPPGGPGMGPGGPARKFKKPKVHRDLDAPDSQPNPRSGLASSVDEFARDMKIVAQGGVGLGVDGAGKNKKRL
ncbi:MAG: hypothetical protein J3R72DRAFT_473181 [Linnemannia gamsii]|nr:MAG: hypothetical protein J3R72DRAFT_473181 [Linnemannia gamsii]